MIHISFFFFWVFTEDVNFWKFFPHGASTYNALEANYFGGPREKVRFQNLVVDRFLENFMSAASEEESILGNDPLVVVTERSLETNVSIFIQREVEKGNMEDIDGSMLSWKSLAFHNMILSRFQLRPLYVYLRSSPEKCLERVKQRGRLEERDVDLDFLQDLHERHEKLYKKLDDRDEKVLILDVDRLRFPNQPQNDNLMMGFILNSIFKFIQIHGERTIVDDDDDDNDDS